MLKSEYFLWNNGGKLCLVRPGKTELTPDSVRVTALGVNEYRLLDREAVAHWIPFCDLTELGKLTADQADELLCSLLERESQSSKGWYSAEEANKYSPDEYDFIWNKTYTRFRLARLKWNDNASYIEGQGDVR